MSRRILLVEDEAIIACEYQITLTSMGYNVVGIACTGLDAIQMAQSRKPDIILMDIRLRGEMDGVTAAAIIRESCPNPIPIVFVSSWISDVGKKNFPNSVFLSKPAGPGLLFSAIESLCDVTGPLDLEFPGT